MHKKTYEVWALAKVGKDHPVYSDSVEDVLTGATES